MDSDAKWLRRPRQWHLVHCDSGAEVISFMYLFRAAPLETCMFDFMANSSDRYVYECSHECLPRPVHQIAHCKGHRHRF